MNCDHCGTPFETYACWAKRKKNHYCGRGCANAAKEKKVKVNCVVCSKEYEVIPAEVKKIVTCSRECLRKRRRDLILKQLDDIGNSAFFNYGVPLCGEQLGNAKLTVEQVRAILMDDRVQRIIAAEYGVEQTLISQIKSGKIWKHVSLNK